MVEFSEVLRYPKKDNYAKISAPVVSELSLLIARSQAPILNLYLDNLDVPVYKGNSNSEEDVKVMAAFGVEALNRVFLDLKGRNKDARLRASHELFNQVHLAQRGQPITLKTVALLMINQICHLRNFKNTIRTSTTESRVSSCQAPKPMRELVVSLLSSNS